MLCRNAGCESEVKDDKFNKIKAQDLGWFFTKDNKAYCPLHTPEWVLGWRAKQDLLKGDIQMSSRAVPFKFQPEEIRQANGEIVQLCVVEELVDEPRNTIKAEAVTTFGGFSLCREHFDDVVHLIRIGTPMGEVVSMMMTDGLNPVIVAEEE